jgi:hypothetical protein
MQTLLGQKPDMTLKELREALGLDCSLPAIHYALSDMGLTYKKRHSAPVSRTGRISPRRARGGAAAVDGATDTEVFRAYVQLLEDEHEHDFSISEFWFSRSILVLAKPLLLARFKLTGRSLLILMEGVA